MSNRFGQLIFLSVIFLIIKASTFSSKHDFDQTDFYVNCKKFDDSYSYVCSFEHDLFKPKNSSKISGIYCSLQFANGVSAQTCADNSSVPSVPSVSSFMPTYFRSRIKIIQIWNLGVIFVSLIASIFIIIVLVTMD